MSLTASERRIAVRNTSFRDGFQSVFGARVFTVDFLPAVEAARHAGFTHFEAGGGACYQSLYLYCNEDAFDMMDAFRTTAGPDANLQTLARGVNVVGLDSQPSDIIDLHARKRSMRAPTASTSAWRPAQAAQHSRMWSRCGTHCAVPTTTSTSTSTKFLRLRKSSKSA